MEIAVPCSFSPVFLFSWLERCEGSGEKTEKGKKMGLSMRNLSCPLKDSKSGNGPPGRYE